jgi:hypothetical protein
MPRKIHIYEVEYKLRIVSNSCPGRDWILLLLEVVKICRYVVLKIRRVDECRSAANVLSEAFIAEPEVSHLPEKVRLKCCPVYDWITIM